MHRSDPPRVASSAADRRGDRVTAFNLRERQLAIPWQIRVKTAVIEYRMTLVAPTEKCVNADPLRMTRLAATATAQNTATDGGAAPGKPSG